MKTMMKLGLIAAVVTMVGCRQQYVIYSHTDKYDIMTTESRGDNLDDYGNLRFKAQEMCEKEGLKGGITVLDARPGGKVSETGLPSYSLAYQCNGREPGIVEKISAAYGSVKKQFGN